MPIPAQSPATQTVNYDSTLITSLIYSGGNLFSLGLARYSSSTGIIQPDSGTMTKVTDATANAAVQSLLSQFLSARNLVGPVNKLIINGGVTAGNSGSVLRGSMRLETGTEKTITQISDVYATAQSDSVFAGLFNTFVAAIASYNAGVKII